MRGLLQTIEDSLCYGKSSIVWFTLSLNPGLILQGMMQAFEADKWILREGDTGTITWTPPRAMQTDKVECTSHFQTSKFLSTV